MLTRRHTYRLVVAALSLGLVLGLVSLCPAEAGTSTLPCAEDMGEEPDACAAHHLPWSVTEARCAIDGTAGCLDEAIMNAPTEPSADREDDVSSGAASLAAVREAVVAPRRPLALDEGSRLDFTSFRSLHLLYGVFLN